MGIFPLQYCECPSGRAAIRLSGLGFTRRKGSIYRIFFSFKDHIPAVFGTTSARSCETQTHTSLRITQIGAEDSCQGTEKKKEKKKALLN